MSIRLILTFQTPMYYFQGGEERTIEQFHFTAWPDKGVPTNVNSILEFRERVLNKPGKTGPIVVHCR
jgi:protein tyrosine phosphatase